MWLINVLVMLLLNMFCSFFVRLINKKWIKKKNLLGDWHEARKIIKKGETRSWLEKVCLHMIYAAYYLVDFPTNVFRLLRNKDKKFTNIVDGIIVFFAVASVVLSYRYYGIYTPLLTAYFVWRVAVILSGKIQSLTEVKENFTKRGVASFNRMVFILFFNIFELTACYTAFYKFLGIFVSNVPYSEAFRIVLGVFITEGLTENVRISCWQQNILIISQFFIIVLFFLMFTANLISLKYREDVTKNKGGMLSSEKEEVGIMKKTVIDSKQSLTQKSEVV